MRLHVYIATSVDGFIAREDGALDWLPPIELEGEDYGYKAFMASIDVLLMGRATFDVALTFPGWPYKGTRVVVLTHRPLELPAAIRDEVGDTVETMSGTPQDIVAALAARGVENVYVDGGAVIQQFLGAGLIDRLIVTRVPVLLGQGIPLFGRLPADIPLRHVRTQAYANGLVQDEYEVAGK